MNQRKVWLVGLALTGALLISALPAQAFHGGWWQGRQVATTNPLFPNPGSTATDVATGEVFNLDIHWAGGGGGQATVTLQLFDQATGALEHRSVFSAVEDISSVTWVNCPFATAFPEQMLEIV